MGKETAKDKLRKDIFRQKKEFTPLDLQNKSAEVFSVLEITGTFQDAQNIFIYNSLSDEVSTLDFINRWAKEKQFFLPVVTGNDLQFVKYEADKKFVVSDYGIKEPEGKAFVEYDKIDMIIVPGVAFDRKLNRMGRGKGYYDRFLPKLKALKVGVCFDFQLLNSIPFDKNDVKMDMIVSENDLIW
ncbi:5-formyltetrahydrofolate cyclo-ligase [Dysgonomonas sp. 216]|uniref:5-formyltetrahydrofolate cyclo-ligase n=1 Tax=Dysgonomonas sp. 216 TaxID=2302934 RepID=UPI0013CF4A11|nr:5-formyltetrahydrofolate cyclo-ligase [Dysgonomonas sp. 216]